MQLVERCQYDGLYIFKYSKRPGTPAAKLHDNVSPAEKKSRFLALENLQRDIQEKIYNEYVGKIVSVLVERQSTRSDQDMTGHSTCHKVVNFQGHPRLAGKIIEVLILEAKSNSLYGKMVA